MKSQFSVQSSHTIDNERRNRVIIPAGLMKPSVLATNRHQLDCLRLIAVPESVFSSHSISVQLHLITSNLLRSPRPRTVSLRS